MGNSCHLSYYLILFPVSVKSQDDVTHCFFSADFEQVVSPVSVAHFSQYKLIKLLLKQLEELKFHICNGALPQIRSNGTIYERSILMGHECVSADCTPDGVIVGTTFLKEGKKLQRNIHCNILIGSDGAGSTVRKLVGIDMKGQRDLQKLVSIHFLSRDLGEFLLQERPGMLFFIFNPEAIGVLVAHDLNKGEFVLQVVCFASTGTRILVFYVFCLGMM